MSETDAQVSIADGTAILSQSTIGGDGGSTSSGVAGAAGNALTTHSISAFNALGDDADLTVQARGGNGGASDTTDGAAGGSGVASVNITDVGVMRANITARGGNGGNSFSGNGGDGGIASIDSANVTSTGNEDINVVMRAIGGGGGSSETAIAGDGGSVMTTPVADLNTTGFIGLTKNVIGGAGGSTDTGTAGAGGNAVASEADLFLDTSFLNVSASATGGTSGMVDGVSGSAATGGDATTNLNFRNSNDAFVFGTAFGGSAQQSASDLSVGGGGDASTNVVAISTTAAAFSSSTATGGNAGMTPSAIAPTASGGDAEANMFATGLTNADARAVATAGQGSTENFLGSVTGQAGDASALAIASSTGGSAAAVATATGRSASAVATGNADDGSASATVNSGLGFLLDESSAIGISSVMSSTVGSQVDVEVVTTADGVLIAAPTDREAFAHFVQTPDGSDVAASIMGQSLVQQSFGATDAMLIDPAAIATMGQIGVSYLDAGIGTHTTDFSATIELNDNFFSDGELAIGFYDPNTIGNGFNSLTIGLTDVSGSVDTLVFTDSIAAMTFFGDNVVSLGMLPAAGMGSSTIMLTVAVEVAQGDAFSSRFVIGKVTAVPEPGYAFAVAAIGVLGWWRRRRTGFNVGK